MKITFSINYHTHWGQTVKITGDHPELGDNNHLEARKMVSQPGGNWILTLDLSGTEEVNYKFLVGSDSQPHLYEEEFGEPRKLLLPAVKKASAEVVNYWRATDHETNALFTAPFTNALFGNVKERNTRIRKKNIVRLKVRVSGLPADRVLAVSGDHPELGKWKPSDIVTLEQTDSHTWQTDFPVDNFTSPIAYKYVTVSKETGAILEWEGGENRILYAAATREVTNKIVYDEYALFSSLYWRGTGVAIPVFSIRSERSAGAGEFSDIKLLADWAARTGMKMIQVLPVNDTTATRTWTDSYPYAAISVFALHPLYLSIADTGKIKDKALQKAYLAEARKLNELDEIDYEAVMNLKWQYSKLLYEQDGTKVFKSKAYKTFLQENAFWLNAYAMFCCLRDQYGTPDFSRWPDYRQVSPKAIENYTDEGSDKFPQVGYYYFLQFHLDKQLKEATAYARKQGVVLKGDIPIGIYRNSVDAWVAPELYNMDTQAGAPPDDFSVSGQNWGFPTYNWEEMSKDGYDWWQQRLKKMTDYFDVFRIDHILGFFRIWEIPLDAVEGILGYFNPSLPYHADEIRQRGISFDHERMCKPFIREHMISEIFGDQANQVKQTYLYHRYDDVWVMQEEFDTQRKIKEHFDRLTAENPENILHYDFLRFRLYNLISEVLFLESPGRPGFYNPRIALHSTYSYRALREPEKNMLNSLYTEYFYRKHNDFWRDQALTKLPALKAATNMLICGEDLGMVPDCVPGVMEQLRILSLAIQRMPNDPQKQFWHPADTTYLSVCSTSSHDMSTIRGWWEENPEETGEFYRNILGHHGGAPYFCEPWIAQEIINQHLYSPSMWAIFPIQDLLAIKGELRRKDPAEERINVPANPKHYWRYRFHMNTEDLLEAESFNKKLENMIKAAGRKKKFMNTNT